MDVKEIKPEDLKNLSKEELKELENKINLEKHNRYEEEEKKRLERSNSLIGKYYISSDAKEMIKVISVHGGNEYMFDCLNIHCGDIDNLSLSALDDFEPLVSYSREGLLLRKWSNMLHKLPGIELDNWIEISEGAFVQQFDLICEKVKEKFLKGSK